MLITFTENVKYSEDGHTVMQGKKFEKRDVSHTAAVALLNAGKAYNSEPETEWDRCRDIEQRLREANMAEAVRQGLIP